MKAQLLLLNITLIVASCIDPAPKIKIVENPLVIEYVVNFYEPQDTDQLKVMMSRKDKVWYQDSMAIESVSQAHLTSDQKGTKQDVKLLHYRFSDLRTNNVYEFENFSDTAKLIRQYSYNDTVALVNGWNFKFKRKWDYNDKPLTLKDTIMDGIKYKRVKLLMGPQADIHEAICYFRCDKDFKIFVLDSALSEVIGCPFVKGFISSPLKKEISLSNEIAYLANEFTPVEKNVFDSWRKYAKEHPLLH